MTQRSRDPYQTLGVSPTVSDEKLRSVYRRLVQLHHPDHNRGSAESARRFEEVQDAYAEIRALRSSTSSARKGSANAGQAPPRATVDPDLESRIADLERELREAQLERERTQGAARESRLARDRARQAAHEAAAQAEGRPSDEELGYVTTDDSFSKILSDARSELSARFSEARARPAATRVADLIDELDELASKLAGDPPRRSRE